MTLKSLTSISFSCFLFAVFSIQGEAKTTFEITEKDYPPRLANTFSSDRALNKSEPKNLQAQLTAAAQGNYMTLTPTSKANARGNPLYHLNLYVNGQLLKTYTSVSGRYNTQDRDRHRSGTEAPLPDGRYQVAKVPIPGIIAEAGDRFLPIQPLFQTGRSALGIHYDPSFEKKTTL